MIQYIFYPGIAESIAKEEKKLKIVLGKTNNVISIVETMKNNQIKETDIIFNQDFKEESNYNEYYR